jgi:hypothetical protein
MPYNEQLDRKRWEMWRVLLKLWRKTRMEYFKKAKQSSGGKKKDAQLTKATFFRREGLASKNIPQWLHDTGIQNQWAGAEEGANEKPAADRNAQEPDGKPRQTLEAKGTSEAACPPIFCSFDPVLASPLTHGYRNKCEFTIGKDGVGGSGEACVGFRLGSFKNGSTRIGSIQGLFRGKQDE